MADKKCTGKIMFCLVSKGPPNHYYIVPKNPLWIFPKSQSPSNALQLCSFPWLKSSFILDNTIYANPVFWVPVSWGKVFEVLRPMPNR